MGFLGVAVIWGEALCRRVESASGRVLHRIAHDTAQLHLHLHSAYASELKGQRYRAMPLPFTIL